METIINEKPNYINHNLNWNGYLRIRQLAKHLGMKENKLRELLIKLGIIKRVTRSKSNQYLLTDVAVMAEIGSIETVEKFGRYRYFNLFNVAKVERYINGDLSLGFNPDDDDEYDDLPF